MCNLIQNIALISNLNQNLHDTILLVKYKTWKYGENIELSYCYFYKIS